MMMIHKAWTYGVGNANDFRKLADDMDKIDESILVTYETKTGLLKKKIDAQQTLIQTALDAQRGLTAEEQAQFDALQREIDDLEKSIAAQKTVEERQTVMNTPVNPPVYAQPKSKDERKFATFGEQLRAVVEAAKPGGTIDPRLSIKAASGLNESVGSDGGFLVEEEFTKELLKRTYETGVLASKCNKIPLSTAANSMKINGVDETSRKTDPAGVGSRPIGKEKRMP